MSYRRFRIPACAGMTKRALPLHPDKAPNASRVEQSALRRKQIASALTHKVLPSLATTALCSVILRLEKGLASRRHCEAEASYERRSRGNLQPTEDRLAYSPLKHQMHHAGSASED
jgi:hypothetical protein